MLEHGKKEALLKPFFIFFALGFILIYLTYSPVIQIPFYHHDGYALSAGGLIGSHVFHFTDFFDNYKWLLDVRARPIGAVIGGFSVKYGYTLEGMSHVRLGGIFFMCLFASMFACLLLRLGITFFNAFLMSIMVFCLPGLQTIIIMNAWFLLFAAFMAFIAHLFINNGFKKWNNGIQKAKCFLFILPGLLCMFISLFTYPAESAFFLVPSLVYILFFPLSQWKITRKIVIRDIVIFAICCVIYFFVGKMMQLLTAPVDLPHPYAFNVNFHVMERIMLLFQIFPSLWNIYYGFNAQALLVYLIILSGVMLTCFSRKKTLAEAQAFLGVLIVLFLGAVPFIFQPDLYIFTRILFIFQVMSLFILVWALKVICSYFWKSENHVFLGTLITLFFIGAVFANYFVAKSALNDNMELNYIVSYLSQHMTGKNTIKRIHVVGGFDSKFNFNGLKSRDDIFNVNSSIYRQDIIYLLDTALLQITKPRIDTLYDCALDEFALQRISEKECIGKAPKNAIVVTYSRHGEKINYTPNMLIINMTEDQIYTKKNLMPLSLLLGPLENPKKEKQ